MLKSVINCPLLFANRIPNFRYKSKKNETTEDNKKKFVEHSVSFVSTQ